VSPAVRTLLVLMATFAWATAASADPGKSAATITGEFGDSCTDFQSHSSKDISHVEVRYAGGGVVKDEAVSSPDFWLEGGDTIDSAIVKSGQTTERFDCDSDSPPVALLEVRTAAEWSSPAFWANTESGDVTFRGTGSTDPDDDIVSWSIDFGDGTSTGGSWSTLPAEVFHTYVMDGGPAVLTVTDSGGRSHSDSMTVAVDNGDGLD
jgi:hypothetical protein